MIVVGALNVVVVVVVVISVLQFGDDVRNCSHWFARPRDKSRAGKHIPLNPPTFHAWYDMRVHLEVHNHRHGSNNR